MLKAVPASVVQRIEVINAPGAEYDAEGVGGIINLAMKGTQAGQQNLDGFSTTLTLEGGTNNVGGNLYSMLQKGRVGLTFSLNGTHGQMPWMDIDMDRSQADGFRSLFQGRMRNKFDFVNSSLDLSLKLSGADRLTLSGSYTYTNFKNPYHADYFSYMNGAPLTTYHMDRGSSVKNHSVTAGAEYVHTFREDYRHRLKLAYQFSAQPAKVDSYVHYSPLEETVGSIPESYDSWGRTNMPEHIIQADYGQPIGEKHLVNMGGK